MTEMRVVTEGLHFPEGPVAMPDGSVVVVEIQSGDLTRVRPDGTKETVAHCGGGPNGAAVGPDGAFYVCNNGGFEWSELMGITAPIGKSPDYLRGSIQRVDPQSGKVEELYTECEGTELCSPNDIVFDSHGGFYFTDIGDMWPQGRFRRCGAIHYARADGSSIREVAFPLESPNGVGLSPDQSRLYFADSVGGRIWYWDIDEPGVLRPGAIPVAPAGGTLLHGLGGFSPLDSLAVDGDGNVCAATLLHGGISVISPGGELLEFMGVPTYDPAVTNICFGGDDLRTAYITSSGLGLLYKTDWPRPGASLAY